MVAYPSLQKVNKGQLLDIACNRLFKSVLGHCGLQDTSCERAAGLLLGDLVDILPLTVVDTADCHGYHTEALCTLFVILVACLEKGRGREKIIFEKCSLYLTHRGLVRLN